MKKIIFAIATIMIMLSLASCAPISEAAHDFCRGLDGKYLFESEGNGNSNDICHFIDIIAD